MTTDSTSAPADTIDRDRLARFLNAIFGDTRGDMAFSRHDDAVLQSSGGIEEVAEFIGTTADEAWVSLRTRSLDGKLWEQAAISADIVSVAAAPLPPSMVLRHEDGSLRALWLIETVDLRTIEVELSEAAPLPGVGGWSIAERHTDRVYTIDALQAALAETAEALPWEDEQPVQANDAWVYGTVDPTLLAREIEIGISPAGAKTMPGRWKSHKTTVGGLLVMLTKHVPGEKDGNCFLAGAVIDGERRASAIPHLDLLVLDLDTGESLEEIRARVRELGLFAVIYTTHSHLKPITAIKKDAVVKWLGGEENPDIDQVVSYLTEFKRYRPWVLEGAELLDSKHTADGVQMFVRHKPMPKFRVVFLLDKRFVIMERKGTQAQAIQEWKERYAGASKLLGAFFDRSCVDPSRLFYTPRHPKDAAEWRIEVIAGKPLDIETVDRVTQEELRKGSQDAFSAAAASMSIGKQYKTSSLLWFFGKYGDRFDIESFLLEMDPDGDRGSRPSGPGRTHRCPNDDAHSDAGNEEDKGFFCINATEADSGQATANCRHDSCSQMDRVDFTDLICEKVGITDATELKKWVPAIIGDEEEEAASEEGVQTSDKESNRAYKNVGEAKRAINALTQDDADAAGHVAANIGMSGFKPTDLVTLKKSLAARSGLGVTVIAEEFKRGKRAAVSGDDGAVSFDDEVRAELGRWNKRHAVVTMGAKVRVLIEPEQGEAPTFMEKDSFATKTANQKVKVIGADGNSKLAPALKTWLEWGERRDYDKVVFEPAGCPQNHYNLWKGLPVIGKRGDWSLLRGHVLDNICLGNDDYFHWLMTWMAQIVQQPGVKLGSCVVVKGRKGVGKSFLFDWLRAALGIHALKISDREGLTNGFNAHQFGLLLMVLEEAFWAGDTSSHGKLKDVITSVEQLMTLKGIDSVRVSNYIRFAMISNEDWIVPAGLEDERRFFVLQCGVDRQGDTAFFGEVSEQMERGGLEAMIYDLTAWKPAGNDWNILRKPPITPWLTEQGQETMTAAEEFFYELVNQGTWSVAEQPDKVSDIVLYDDKPNVIPVMNLRWFLDHATGRTRSNRRVVSLQKFDKLLSDWLLAERQRVQTHDWNGGPYGKGSDDPRPLCVRMPPLRVIRESVAKRKNLSFTEVMVEVERNPLEGNG